MCNFVLPLPYPKICPTISTFHLAHGFYFIITFMPYSFISFIHINIFKTNIMDLKVCVTYDWHGVRVSLGVKLMHFGGALKLTVLSFGPRFMKPYSWTIGFDYYEFHFEHWIYCKRLNLVDLISLWAYSLH